MMATPLVTSLDDPAALTQAAAVQAYGGKGANLIVLRQQLQLPVPPAFILSTAAWRQWHRSGWSAALEAVVREQVGILELNLGRRFGGDRDPLLVSVRSSGAVSMPGMMDTVLNVGATPDSIAALARIDAEFARDIWKRFCEGYASTVLGLPRASAGAEGAQEGSRASVRAAEAIRRLAAGAGTPIPDDPWQQLRAAIE